MNLIYAGLLLHSAGKELSETNIKKVADATGESIEPAQIKALVAALDGVNIEEAIKKAAVAPVAVPAPSGEEKAVKKEEKKEEDAQKKSEDAAAGLGQLFG